MVTCGALRLSETPDSLTATLRYQRTIGDNPSCSSGPPISIGWHYLSSYEISVDEYEKQRRGGGNRKAFHLSPSKRSRFLSEWEISEDDIAKAEHETSYIQYCRQKSLMSIRRGRKSSLKQSIEVFEPNDANLPTAESDVPVSLSRPDTDSDCTDQPDFNRRGGDATLEGPVHLRRVSC